MGIMKSLLLLVAVIAATTIVVGTVVASLPATQTAHAQCVIQPEPGSCNALGGINQADRHVGSDMPQACSALSAVKQRTTGMPIPCG